MHSTLWTIRPLELGATFHFLINEAFMALFFGIAAQELAEATMKVGDSLRRLSGLLPMMACADAVIAPAVILPLICTPARSGAWAVPGATDIAFACFGARMIPRRSHPAVTFLLAIAVADDSVGMGIRAICYPVRRFNATGLLLSILGVTLAFALRRGSRHVRWLRTWQAFSFPGVVCWPGLLLAGLEPVLALVFVVPFIPMAGRDIGIFAESRPRSALPARTADAPAVDTMRDLGQQEPPADPINQFERAVKPFVDTGLYFFGLANAGVAWWGRSLWDQDSEAVFLRLGFGKTLGITTFTRIGYLALRWKPRKASVSAAQDHTTRLGWRELPVIGLLEAIAFTVALFVAGVVGGHASLKLGAMASFVYLVAAIGLGMMMLTIRPPDGPSELKTGSPPGCREPAFLPCVGNRRAGSS